MTKLSLSQNLIDDLIKQYPDQRELIIEAVETGSRGPLYKLLTPEIKTNRNSWYTVEVVEMFKSGGQQAILDWVTDLSSTTVALELFSRLERELSPSRCSQLPT